MSELKDFATYPISWNLTPEDAVTLYLEWGNNDWKAENPPVRSKEDVSYYFVVDTWEDPPIIRLVRRNSENADDLFTMPLPESLRAHWKAENGDLRGLYAPSEKIKDWLKAEMAK